LKLSMHIIREDLANMCAFSRISSDESLTLMSVKVLGELDTPPTKDTVYIGNPEDFKRYPFFQDIQAFILVEDEQGKTFKNVAGKDFICTDKRYSKLQVLTRVQEIFDYYNRWELNILNVILHKGCLDEVLKIGFQVFQNPMVVFDISLIRIAMIGEEYVPDSDFWKSVIETGHPPLKNCISVRKNKKIFELVRDSKKPFIYILPDLEYKTLHANLFHKDIKCGFLVIDESLTPFTNKTLGLAGYFSVLVANVLERNAALLGKSRDVEMLSFHLFANRSYEDIYSEYLMNMYNWNKNDHFQLYVLTPFYSENHSTPFVNLKLLQNIINYSCIFHYNDQIIIIQNLSKAGKQLLLEDLKMLMVNIEYVCGISNVFYNFSNLKNYYEQACLAYTIGQHQHPKERVFKYSDYILNHTLNLLEEKVDLLSLCHPAVMKLYLYDQENNTKYLNTLYVYLCCRKNLSETAKKLFIHRNTCVYRLNKIYEIIGKDFLDDENKYLVLLFSCFIIKHTFPQEGL
jgi:hypothetical protein